MHKWKGIQNWWSHLTAINVQQDWFYIDIKSVNWPNSLKHYANHMQVLTLLLCVFSLLACVSTHPWSPASLCLCKFSLSWYVWTLMDRKTLSGKKTNCKAFIGMWISPLFGWMREHPIVRQNSTKPSVGMWLACQFCIPLFLLFTLILCVLRAYSQSILYSTVILLNRV